MKKGQLSKLIIGIVAMFFLLAGNAWADGKRHGGPQDNGGHHNTQYAKPNHGGPGAHHPGPSPGHRPPPPHHSYHQPPQHHQHYAYHHPRPHHYHTPPPPPRHSRPVVTDIRISPDPNRVILSALFANPLLLFDITVRD